MTARSLRIALWAAALAALAAPWLLPSLLTQLAFLWLMIVFALTWDVMGGQTGYNSFGNILFFGIGAYTCAVIQRDVGLGYAGGFAAGIAGAGAVATLVAVVLGPAILALRGHYFAIATLGLGAVAADLAAGWRAIGAASGMTTPQFSGAIEDRARFFYYLLLAVAVFTILTLRRLYAGYFGLAINAIRDDEDKAEAMGLNTSGCKILAWAVAAFFLGLAGAITGNLVGYIDPRELAFAGSTYGVWMVLMAILGGRGTLWGPVVGACIFHVTQELFWTFLLGWQRVAMGIFILAIVMYLPQGVAGCLRRRTPPASAGATEVASR
jgi:branched-chain amino acid transport system permease protein